jgi:hypothetical protein
MKHERGIRITLNPFDCEGTSMSGREKFIKAITAPVFFPLAVLQELLSQGVNAAARDSKKKS